jgi:hypothetical protein
MLAMLLSRYNNGVMELFPQKLENIQVDVKYMMLDGFERGMYKGQKNTYFKERIDRDSEAYIMSRQDGSKPFAVATNDCLRDDFDSSVLSKVLVYKGFYIIHAYFNENAKNTDPLNFIVFEVLDDNPKESLIMNNGVLVKAVHKFTSLDEIPELFSDVVAHVMDVISCTSEAQLIPKYCFNPNRLITMRLFVPNDHNELKSYNKNGQRLILNGHTRETIRDESGEIIKGGLYRVFFSRKFKDSNHIFVDGRLLPPLLKKDLPKYLKTSQLEESITRSIVKEVLTHSGFKFYAISTVNGGLRPIFESTIGYSSFPMSAKEFEFIKEINNVEEWD